MNSKKKNTRSEKSPISQDKNIHELPLLYQRIMMYALRKAQQDVAKLPHKLRSGTMVVETT